MEKPWSSSPRYTVVPGGSRAGAQSGGGQAAAAIHAVGARRHRLVVKQVHQVNGLAFVIGDQAAFDQVLQFAHIAREVVAQQNFQGAHGNAHRRSHVFLAEAREERVDQQRDVVPAVAQRGRAMG